MRKAIGIACGILLLAISVQARAGVWELDSEYSETRLFDRAIFVYRSTAAARRPYDIDPFGAPQGGAGSIRLDFAAQSIVITGLELPLPIDTDAKVFAALARVCDDLIAACDQGTSPTVKTISLGTAECSTEFILPNSLQPVAFVNVRHSSGERFSITQVGFVAFALRELEGLRRDSIGRFGAAAKSLKAECGPLFAAALLRQYNPKAAIASTLEQFTAIRPLLEGVLASECAKAEAEAGAILARQAGQLTKDFQERIDHGYKTYDGSVSDYVARTLGSGAQHQVLRPNDPRAMAGEPVALTVSPSIEDAIGEVAENLRKRLVVAVDNIVLERMGRTTGRLLAEETALVRKFVGVSHGSTIYTAEEQVKVDLMNALAGAMYRHEVSPSDLQAQRTLRELTIEVGRLGRFSPNPEYTGLVEQLDRLRTETVSRLGVSIDKLRAYSESRS